MPLNARNPAALGYEGGGARVVVRESIILGLSAPVADINLLNDYRELHHRKGVIPLDVVDIEAALSTVSFDHLFTEPKPRLPGGHRGPFDPRWIIVGFHPLVEEVTEIHERVAAGAHVPIENGDGNGRIIGIDDHVVELVVVVQDGDIAR